MFAMRKGPLSIDAHTCTHGYVIQWQRTGVKSHQINECGANAKILTNAKITFPFFPAHF